MMWGTEDDAVGYDIDALGSDMGSEDALGSSEDGEGEEDAEGSEEGSGEEEEEEEEEEEPMTVQFVLPETTRMEVEAYDDDDREYNGEIEVQPDVDNCVGYEINPFAACIHPTSINCMAATRNTRWLFTGGDDGFIRKFDFAATISGDQSLTQTQKHGLVDSIEKAGVLVSAWENKEYPSTYDPATIPPIDADNPPPLSTTWSPVYSIDVHSEAVWCLTGCKNGSINLWSVRHDEGHCQHVLRGHTNAVSVLRITPGERGVISGSWDRTLLSWDLDTGRKVRTFQDLTSQVTSASFGPSSASSYSDIMDIDDATAAMDGVRQLPTAGDSLLMATTYDGAVLLFDQRDSNGVGIKWTSVMSKAPPWCLSACWSVDGRRIYCGRRNATVDEFDVVAGRHLRTIRLPRDSGPVSYVATLPNSRHLLCASQDVIRLWDLELTTESPAPGNTPMPQPALLNDSASAADIPFPTATPLESATNTPRLPTAGLNLFLDDSMGMGSDVLTGTLSSGLESDVSGTAIIEENKGKGGAKVVIREEDLMTPPVVPFTIVPGHNGGVVSTIFIDPTKRYMVSASGNRGWDGVASNLCLVYDIKPIVAPEE